MKISCEMGITSPATVRAVEDCLAWIPNKDLAGLNDIKIFECLSDTGPLSTGWQIECEREGYLVSASYFREHEKRPPFVGLYLDALLFPIEPIIRFRPITTLYFANSIAHEVAHHLVASRGYIFSPEEQYDPRAYDEKRLTDGGITAVEGLKEIHEEKMADKYAVTLVDRMKASWHYRVAARTLLYLSKLYFEEGRQRWKKKNFIGASLSWYKAWLLDESNDNAFELYLHAKSEAAK